MSEQKLQADIVRKFSERYPLSRGLLFAVNNEANSKKQAMHFKALGVRRGVSDLIYFQGGVMTCIELKYPGKKHDTNHIKEQLSWGIMITGNGGRYYIVTNILSFFSIINRNPDQYVYTVEKLKIIIKQAKSTITFW